MGEFEDIQKSLVAKQLEKDQARELAAAAQTSQDRQWEVERAKRDVACQEVLSVARYVAQALVADGVEPDCRLMGEQVVLKRWGRESRDAVVLAAGWLLHWQAHSDFWWETGSRGGRSTPVIGYLLSLDHAVLSLGWNVDYYEGQHLGITPFVSQASVPDVHIAEIVGAKTAVVDSAERLGEGGQMLKTGIARLATRHQVDLSGM